MSLHSSESSGAPVGFRHTSPFLFFQPHVSIFSPVHPQRCLSHAGFFLSFSPFYIPPPTSIPLLPPTPPQVFFPCSSFCLGDSHKPCLLLTHQLIHLWFSACWAPPESLSCSTNPLQICSLVHLLRSFMEAIAGLSVRIDAIRFCDNVSSSGWFWKGMDTAAFLLARILAVSIVWAESRQPPKLLKE